MSGPSAKAAKPFQPIYLVGMMGTGKSTVGVRLATRLGRSFIDTDQEVEAAERRSIAEIFETDGEAHFRMLEAKAIDRASEAGAVIALGGGAIAQPEIASLVLSRGVLVWLQADVKTLVDRVGNAASRPLLAGLNRSGQIAKLASLLEERRAYYEQATIAVDAGAKPDDVVSEIVSQLGNI